MDNVITGFLFRNPILGAGGGDTTEVGENGIGRWQDTYNSDGDLIRREQWGIWGGAASNSTRTLPIAMPDINWHCNPEIKQNQFAPFMVTAVTITGAATCLVRVGWQNTAGERSSSLHFHAVWVKGA